MTNAHVGAVVRLLRHLADDDRNLRHATRGDAYGHARLGEHVFQAISWRERFGPASARVRLAKLLVELSNECGETIAIGQRIRFRLTQGDLARMIGFSRLAEALLTCACSKSIPRTSG